MLLLTFLIGAAAPDAPKPQSLVLLPVVAFDERLGNAVAVRLQETAERSPELRLFHSKVANVVLESMRVPAAKLSDLATARDVGRRVGATLVLQAQLTAAEKKAPASLQLALITTGGDVVATAKGTSTDAQGWLDTAPALLIKVLEPALGSAAIEPMKAPAVPVQAAAYLEYAECHRLLGKQQVSLRSPVLLDPENRAEAMKHCQSAVQLQPTLKQAHAALAFALALANEKEEAEAELAKVKDVTVPYYVIAKFWVLSRFYDGKDAVQFLREALVKQPGFMLARGYLGETLNALGRYDEALEAFRRYLVDVPDSPWGLTQVGYSLAKQKKFGEALDASIKAVTVAGDDDETKLELASRFVDANKLDDARRMLDVLARSPEPNGEVLLRLGYVYLLQGKLDDAERYCSGALDRASKAREWRTRGRARYDLAKIALRRGEQDKAIEQLEKAFGEGYRNMAKLAEDSDFNGVRSLPRFLALTARSKPAQIVVPTFATPFAHDALSGEHLALGPAPVGKPVQRRSTGIAF